MSVSVLILLIALIVLQGSFRLLSRRRPILRMIAGIFGAILLLLVSGARAFGILASFEITTLARLPFEIGYGLIGLAALLGAIRLTMAACRKPAPELSERWCQKPPVVNAAHWPGR